LKPPSVDVPSVGFRSVEAQSVDCVVFSRDRAMQLDAFLRSMRRHVGSLYRSVSVLYRATSSAFAAAYGELMTAYRDVAWKEESVFAEDLRALLTEGRWTVFHTDDDVFFRSLEPPGLRADEVCYSLRLGLNVEYSYTLDLAERLEGVSEEGSRISWDWRAQAPGSFSYPLAVNGHIFRTADVAVWLDALTYRNPNELEAALQWFNSRIPPRMAAARHSSVVNIPANVVNDTFENRSAGEHSVEELNDRFLAGERIDLRRMDFSNVGSAHVEVPFAFAPLRELAFDVAAPAVPRTKRRALRRDATHWETVAGYVAERARELEEERRWFAEQREAWEKAAREQAAVIDELREMLELKSDDVSEAAPEDVATEESGEHSPLVTIIVDLTDAGPDVDGPLKATADSLMRQTLAAWELVLVGGPSSLRLGTGQAKQLPAASRARALEAAIVDAGDFVVFLDPGETLPATALEKWSWLLALYPEHAAVTLDRSRPTAPVMLRKPDVLNAGADAARATGEARAVSIELSTGAVELPGNAPSDVSAVPNAWLEESWPFANRFAFRGRRHLLLLTPWLRVGGADKVTLDLLDQMAERGWTASIATTIPAEHNWLPLYASRTPDVFPLNQFLRLVDYPRFLTYLIESRQPDVVLLSNSELAYRLLPYLRSRSPRTTFVDFCHSEAEHWNEGGYPRFSVEYHSQLDLTITASSHLRTWLIDRGALPERVAVSYANVDSRQIRPDSSVRAQVRRELGIAEDEPVILFAGRVADDKQPAVLAETLNLLARRGSRFTGVIAGGGPDLTWLGGYLRARGLHRRVRLLGEVSHAQMIRAMQAADLLFLPSRWEGIALTLYEAMACGIPVVAAAVGGQAELVTPDCGILIERSTIQEEAIRYADALGALIADRGRLAVMGVNARERITTHFDLARMGARMEELFDLAIELHKTNPRAPVPPPIARAVATEAIELTRLTLLMDRLWVQRDERVAEAGGLRGMAGRLYLWLRSAGGPVYRYGLARGWIWLPRVRDQLRRALLRTP
jgi:glycosyltransferase involved in cell wall biosynthesis